MGLYESDPSESGPFRKYEIFQSPDPDLRRSGFSDIWIFGHQALLNQALLKQPLSE